MNILNLEIDKEILEYARAEGLIIFGLKAWKYNSPQELATAIEENLCTISTLKSTIKLLEE